MSWKYRTVKNKWVVLMEFALVLVEIFLSNNTGNWIREKYISFKA